MERFYDLLGAFFWLCAMRQCHRDRSGAPWSRICSWGLLGASLISADYLPYEATGSLFVASIVCAVLADRNRVRPRRSQPNDDGPDVHRRASAIILLPLLAIPLSLLLCGAAEHVPQLATVLNGEGNPNVALASYAIGCVAAALTAIWVCRIGGKAWADEASSALDGIGSTLWLPILLAIFGVVLSGSAQGIHTLSIFFEALPLGRFQAIAVYCLVMLSLTVAIGNAYASFPVVFVSLGLPILIRKLGLDAGAVAAIGMLSAYCGTLLTPLAANFNVVPCAILNIERKSSIIAQQIPVAFLVAITNVFILYYFG